MKTWEAKIGDGGYCQQLPPFDNLSFRCLGYTHGAGLQRRRGKKHKRKEGKKKQAGSSCKHRTRADGHQKIHHHHHLSLFGAAIGCSPHCVMIKVFKSARFLFNRQRPHALTDVIKRRYTFQYKIPPKWWGKKSRAFPLGRGPTSVVWISLEREATRVHCNSGHASGQFFFFCKTITWFLNRNCATRLILPKEYNLKRQTRIF